VTRQIARFQNDRWTGQRQARKMQRKKRWLEQRRKQASHSLIDAAGNEGVLLSFPIFFLIEMKYFSVKMF